MKTLLVKPYNLSDHIQPSLGLGYLATACRNHHHDVTLLDCLKENVKLDDLFKRINRLKPDVVGFQCYTFDLEFIKAALEGCKAANPNITTVIGGPHPSAVPEQTFEMFGNSLDFVFTGEAEKGFPALLNHLSKEERTGFEEIPGLVWRENTHVRRNPQLFWDDLDNLGMPAWDMIRPEEYPPAQHGAFFKKFPIAPIMVTRGCPFSCTFCAGNTVSGKRIRKHSIDFMINQILYLYDQHKIREFHIVDDNFTFDKEFAKEFLRKLIALNLDISWSTPNGVHVRSLDEELLGLMKQSGLYLISLGIESGSNRVLNLMKKTTSTQEIRQSIKLIRFANIDIAGFFIMGFPGETKDEIQETIQFSLDLDLCRANYFTFLPFPGSLSYDEIKANREENLVDWKHFYFMNAAYTPKGMTRHELKNLQRSAFMKFYLRPKILWKNISGIKSLRHFWYLLKRFFHWIIMS